MSDEHRHFQNDRRHRRAFRVGLAASALLHVLVFVIFAGQSLPPSPFAAAGERQREARAAKGGGLEAVELRPPEVLAEAVPVPVPVVDVAEEEAPDPEPEVEETVIALGQAVALPGSSSPGAEPGVADGTAAGDGGTESEGLFRVVPPRPRGLTLPPGDRPNDVRGKEIEVWVYVSAAGQVVPDSTRLFPGSGDRRFDRRLRDHAAAWVFEAARRDGRAVAEWFRYTLIM
jgi:outer membrane biosynthesis protein TonB